MGRKGARARRCYGGTRGVARGEMARAQQVAQVRHGRRAARSGRAQAHVTGAARRAARARATQSRAIDRAQRVTAPAFVGQPLQRSTSGWRPAAATAIAPLQRRFRAGEVRVGAAQNVGAVGPYGLEAGGKRLQPAVEMVKGM